MITPLVLKIFIQIVTYLLLGIGKFRGLEPSTIVLEDFKPSLLRKTKHTKKKFKRSMIKTKNNKSKFKRSMIKSKSLRKVQKRKPPRKRKTPGKLMDDPRNGLIDTAGSIRFQFLSES